MSNIYVSIEYLWHQVEPCKYWIQFDSTRIKRMYVASALTIDVYEQYQNKYGWSIEIRIH